MKTLENPPSFRGVIYLNIHFATVGDRNLAIPPWLPILVWVVRYPFSCLARFFPSVKNPLFGRRLTMPMTDPRNEMLYLPALIPWKSSMWVFIKNRWSYANVMGYAKSTMNTSFYLTHLGHPTPWLSIAHHKQRMDVLRNSRSRRNSAEVLLVLLV